MAKILWVLVVIIILGLLAYGAFSYFSPKTEKYLEKKLLQTKSFNMKLTSPAFEDNQIIPEQYTCNGDNINPSLIISETPENAQSLVLIVSDPDSPAGIFQHWIVYNIAPEINFIKKDSMPEEAIQLKNDFGVANYGGPCPGTGTHRYFFKIYALDQKLDLPVGAKLQDLEEKMNGHILDSGELVGLYSKK